MKIVGIVGGMGPLATYDLANKIVTNTRASRDQEHIHVCIDCNTNIPDRTAAILGGGEDPLPEMIRSALRLEEMGAQILLMPCNTAHYFYEELCSYLDVPMLHMPGETALCLKKKQISCAGVLATDGTIQSGVYEKVLGEQGIRTVYPSEEEQRQVMRIIYERVKAGRPDITGIPVSTILNHLRTQGAQAVILGCTELPIALKGIVLEGCPLADPVEILARAAISYAGGALVRKI